MILFAKILTTFTGLMFFLCLVGTFKEKDVNQAKASLLSLIVYAPYLIFLIMYLNGG